MPFEQYSKLSFNFFGNMVNWIDFAKVETIKWISDIQWYWSLLYFLFSNSKQLHQKAVVQQWWISKLFMLLYMTSKLKSYIDLFFIFTEDKIDLAFHCWTF